MRMISPLALDDVLGILDTSVASLPPFVVPRLLQRGFTEVQFCTFGQYVCIYKHTQAY